MEMERWGAVEEVSKRHRALLDWLRSHDYNYASLNTVPGHPLVEFFQRRVPGGGILVRQLFRLSPVNLRGCFRNRGDGTAVNPKATILLAAALAGMVDSGDRDVEGELKMLLDRIVNMRSAHCRNFAIRQNKTLYMLKYSADEDEVAPLLTAMAGLLFLGRAGRGGNDGRSLEIATSVMNYFEREHPVDCYPEGFYFRYDPKYRFITYNASAFISGFLLAAGKELGSAGAVEMGRRGIDFVIAGQNRDGSWFYGAGNRYIDSFHSFIIIWAMQLAADAGYDAAVGSLDKALGFWVDNFGRQRKPRHFTGGHLPLNSSLLQRVDLRDLSIPAVFFMKYRARYPEYRELTENLVAQMVCDMSNGTTFYPEKTWLWTNRIPYIEFQAWALLVLTTYLEKEVVK